MANIFKDAAQSFYSGVFYGELARSRKGIGLGLIAFMTLLVSCLMCAGLVLNVQLREAVEQFPQVATKLPMITLNAEGRLSIDKPVPYRLDIGRASQSIFLVIDTGYKRNDGTFKYMRDNHILLLVTADEAILDKIQQNELEIYEFRGGQPITITHDDWLKIAATVSDWGFPALAAVFFMSFTIAMFLLNIAATVFSAVAIMIIDLILATRIEFAGAMRMAAALRIPVNILPAVPGLFGLPWLANSSGWVLWMIYIGFAVSAVRLYSAAERR